MSITDEDWVLNYEPFKGKDHYIIWVAGKGQIAEIICPNKDDAHILGASKSMYEALNCCRILIEEQFPNLMKSYNYEQMLKALAKAEGK